MKKAILLALMVLACGGAEGGAVVSVASSGPLPGETPAPAVADEAKSREDVAGGSGGTAEPDEPREPTAFPVVTAAGSGGEKNAAGGGAAGAAGSSDPVNVAGSLAGAAAGAGGDDGEPPVASCLTEEQKNGPGVEHYSEKVPDSYDPLTKCWDWTGVWYLARLGKESAPSSCWERYKLCIQ